MKIELLALLILVLAASACAPATLYTKPPTLPRVLQGGTTSGDPLHVTCSLTNGDAKTLAIPNCQIVGQEIPAGSYKARVEAACQEPVVTTHIARPGKRLVVEFELSRLGQDRYLKRSGTVSLASSAFFESPYGTKGKRVMLPVNTGVTLEYRLPDQSGACSLALATLKDGGTASAQSTYVIVPLDELADAPDEKSARNEQTAAQHAQEAARSDKQERANGLAAEAKDFLGKKNDLQAHEAARLCLTWMAEHAECLSIERETRGRLGDRVPDHVKDAAAYQEGDGLALYISLVDARGAYVRLDGTLYVDIEASTRGVVMGKATIGKFRVKAADFQDAEVGLGALARRAVIAPQRIPFSKIYRAFHDEERVGRMILDGWSRDYDLHVVFRFYDVLGDEHRAAERFIP